MGSDDRGTTGTSQLDQSGSKLEQNYSPQQESSGEQLQCEAKASSQPKKRYYHVGLRFKVQQYNIAGRKMKLELPIRPNSALANMDAFHALTGSEYAPAAADETPRAPKKLYAIGGAQDAPDHYEGDLACATQLIAEDGLEGYQKGGKQGDLNEFLGKAIAMHLSRTRTFRVASTGNFDAKDLQRVDALAETEKMGIKLFVYLRAKVDNKTDRIFEVVNGELGAVVSDSEYRQRKLIESKPHSDSEGGAMPFIPGVYQIHALIEGAAEGSFALKEVYCDGDCIYPE